MGRIRAQGSSPSLDHGICQIVDAFHQKCVHVTAKINGAVEEALDGEELTLPCYGDSFAGMDCCVQGARVVAEPLITMELELVFSKSLMSSIKRICLWLMGYPELLYECRGSREDAGRG